MLNPILTPLSAPSSFAAAPLSRVKEQLGIAAGDTSKDAELGRLIRAASREFAGVHGLRRDYWRRSWRIRAVGHGGVFLPLPVWPIESVSSVTEGTGDTPATLDPTAYEIADPDRSALYRAGGWLLSESRLPGRQVASADPLDYTVACVAGWVMPEKAPEWSAALGVAASGYVRPTAPSLFLFQATAGGTTGGTEPTWPTALGGTVADNGITWTAVAAQRLPDDLEAAAIVTVLDWYRGGLELAAGVASESHAGHSITYATGAAAQVGANPIPPAARAILAAYR